MGSKGEWIAKQAIRILVVGLVIQVVRGINSDWGASLGLGAVTVLVAGTAAWIIVEWVKRS